MNIHDRAIASTRLKNAIDKIESLIESGDIKACAPLLSKLVHSKAHLVEALMLVEPEPEPDAEKLLHWVCSELEGAEQSEQVFNPIQAPWNSQMCKDLNKWWEARVEASATEQCDWRGMACPKGEGCQLHKGHDGPHEFRDGGTVYKK